MEKEAVKHDKSIFEIPLAEAKELTAAWAARGNFIKGFLIDKDELQDMLREPGTRYLRVYFGWDVEMEVGREQRMIMVPADIYGKDMINKEGSEEAGDGEVNSNIFDFTMPCPPTCSPDEILNP
ncbi:hypothetical protein [Pedobacter gandavensis]|uniref:hypothetical protein n=1 Tax=Pedobacter gandavensis TaxID=2679963 RepID=UPI002931DF7D|nr:hypothetical protein [Pedobacter gandavensis]